MPHLWYPFLVLFPAGELAASIKLPQPQPPESVWVLGDYGQSCTAACGAIPGAESSSCSEERTRYLDTLATFQHIATNELGLFGQQCQCEGVTGCMEGTHLQSEFPTLDTGNNLCAFRAHEWVYQDSCHAPTVPASHRFCSCGGAWYRSLIGESCDATCAAQGAACEELPMEECITEECVQQIANDLGIPCSSRPIWAKEYPSQLPNLDCAYTYGWQDRCDETVGATVQRFCPCEVVMAAEGFDGVGEGDPHMTTIYGQTFEINLAGVHSLIRIPGYGPGAGKTLDLSARVADFSHLKQISHCHPHYFDMIDLRGELLGGTVDYMEVLRGSATGVSFSASGASFSLWDQNLSVRETLAAGAAFGNVTVRHETRGKRKDLLVLKIQADPPIEVTVNWWNHNHGQPGLNLRVHGLRTKWGPIGGLMGQDDHGNVSAELGLEGCPPRATGASPEALANLTIQRGGVSMIDRDDELLPDVVVY